jgi:branched-chain amino acid transport system ATP-binding protein
MLVADAVESGYERGVSIVRDVSLRVRQGEIVCLIGPNGSGKSTFLNTLAGFLKPVGGTVSLDSRDITRLEPHERVEQGLVYVMQRRSIVPRLTVKQNLEIGGWIMRKDRARVEGAVAAILDLFPAPKDKQRESGLTLSGGQARMLEFARALITDPRVILVDEPSFGVAPIEVRTIYAKLLELKERGKALLLVDQNIRRGIEVADHVYVLESGRVIDEGPKSDFVAKFDRAYKGWFIPQ